MGKNVLSEDPRSRTEKWLIKWEGLTPAGKRAELARCAKEFYRQPESRLYRLTGDLQHVPATNDLDSDTADEETVAKVQELIAFIKMRFGKRCVDAAQAIMAGCRNGEEVGARMGVTRQTADEHIENLRSPDVQTKAIQLGLVSRASFIEAMKKAESLKTKSQRRAAKKVTRKVVKRKKAKAKSATRRRRQVA